MSQFAFNRYGKRTFKMGAAILWNSITDGNLKQSKDITTFKRQLKTCIHCSDIIHHYYSLCIICI